MNAQNYGDDEEHELEVVSYSSGLLLPSAPVPRRTHSLGMRSQYAASDGSLSNISLPDTDRQSPADDKPNCVEPESKGEVQLLQGSGLEHSGSRDAAMPPVFLSPSIQLTLPDDNPSAFSMEHRATLYETMGIHEDCAPDPALLNERQCEILLDYPPDLDDELRSLPVTLLHSIRDWRSYVKWKYWRTLLFSHKTITLSWQY